MIHQKRFPEPEIPIYQPKGGLVTPAQKEKSDAINFYKKAENLDKPYDGKFKVYKDPLLAAKLNEVFNGKCAYCDGNYKAGTPDDIEHFRPKGMVNKFTNLEGNASERPGYYWLAADWENLLISCPRCNRAEKYFSESRPTLWGKKDRFPVADESKRAKKPDDNLDEEGALLLNPCVDNPEEYFNYVIEGDTNEIGLIKVRADIDEERKKRAEASWIIYALNRPPLVADRRKCVTDLNRDISQLVAAIWIFVKTKQTPAADTTHEKENLDLAIQRLKAVVDKTSPYLGIKRQMFQQALQWETVKELKEKLNVDMASFLN